ncbi:uncharacterized protein METZ01_LOCUS114661, partial [marine metagenome]
RITAFMIHGPWPARYPTHTGY